MGNASGRASRRGKAAVALVMAWSAGLAVAGPAEEWDRTLRERIESRLLGQVAVETDDVRVQVEDGRVRLEGTVPTARDAVSIERLVRGYVEVQGVVNRITIRAMERPDMAIAQEVRDALDRYPALRWPQVTVSVDEGVVVLSGRVQEAVDRTVAGLETSSIAGVEDIRNLLEIEAIGAGRAVASRVYSLLRNPLTFGNVRSLGVRVEDDGTVVLTGAVWREADRIQAERLALTVHGVERITNLIQVDTSGNLSVQPGDSTVQ